MLQAPDAIAALAAAALVTFAGTACMGGSGSTAAETGATVSSGAETTVATPPVEVTADNFDPAIFDPERSFVIDNEWLPMKPGTRAVHRGWTEEDGEKLPHRIVSIVTDLTKDIGASAPP